MFDIKFKKSPGLASRTLIILAVVVFLAMAVVYLALSLAGGNQQAQQNQKKKVDEPVYEKTLGDIRLVLESSIDMGSILPAKDRYQNTVTTTGRFIKVVVGAQNKGKIDTTTGSWDIGNIIDSEGRNFVAVDSKAYHYLPKPNSCGAILKPEFDPVPCTKIYEVSKESRGMKVVVTSLLPARATSLLDLNLPGLEVPQEPEPAQP